MSHQDIRVATFDCYGTLIDWEGGIAAFLYDLALRRGDPSPEPGWKLREQWETIQFEMIQGPYHPYEIILRESLHRWCLAAGYAWEDDEGPALVRAMRSWQPFPDTRPALERVKAAGWRLAILSNTDRDIIEHSLRHLAIPFDAVVTAEDCGSYKPATSNFEQLLTRIGESSDDVLHVAFGFKYDIGPAKQLGFRTAWVNRHGENAPGPEQPDYTWRDLWGLGGLARGGDLS